LSIPTKKEHIRLSKRYLGYSIPIVHDILDRYLPIPEHRRTHRPEMIKLIGELLGEEAKTEAWLHFLADYGFVKGKWLKKPIRKDE